MKICSRRSSYRAGSGKKFKSLECIGPAVRRDREIIKKPLKLMEDHPQLKHLYQEMTESIKEDGSE